MIADIHQETESRMQKAVKTLQGELVKIRTGRAHPSLVEGLRISCYGSEMPLSQVASIATSDPRTLSITPWDKTLVGTIEKAIQQSDLGLNPSTAGSVIRIPIPPMTEERRKELIKHIYSEGEEAKIAIRNIRRDANTALKNLLKEKAISEDEERRANEKVQKITDKAIADIDAILAKKESELLEI